MPECESIDLLTGARCLDTSVNHPEHSGWDRSIVPPVLRAWANPDWEDRSPTGGGVEKMVEALSSVPREQRVGRVDVAGALAARDAGIEQAEANADSLWLASTWGTLLVYLLSHAEFFVDDFWAETGISAPRDARALGVLVGRASRKGFIEKSGQFRPSIRSAMTEKPVWTSLTYYSAPVRVGMPPTK